MNIDRFGNFLNENEEIKPMDEIYNHTKKLLDEFEEKILKNHKNEKIEWDIIQDEIDLLKTELGKDLVRKLNLDIFMSNFYTITGYKTDTGLIKRHFDNYLEGLESRLKKILSKDDRYIDVDLDLKMQEYNKLKKQTKSRISKKNYEKKAMRLQLELRKLEDWIVDNDKKIVIIFEGRDAAGKGGCIGTITEYLNPKYFKVATFGVPTENEKKHWFERYIKYLPKPGKMTIYDRSWYNRAVNDPVMGYCTEKQHEEFMETVNGFEQQLIDDGYIIFKFWLSVNKDIQSLRFKLRKLNPLKKWKFSENDLKTMDKWSKFTFYKEKMFKQTSTKECPWVSVNSDDKKLARLNVIRYILKNIPYMNKGESYIGKIKPEILIPLI
jgi:polyphosphate kinase